MKNSSTFLKNQIQSYEHKIEHIEVEHATKKDIIEKESRSKNNNGSSFLSGLWSASSTTNDDDPTTQSSSGKWLSLKTHNGRRKHRMIVCVGFVLTSGLLLVVLIVLGVHGTLLDKLTTAAASDANETNWSSSSSRRSSSGKKRVSPSLALSPSPSSSLLLGLSTIPSTPFTPATTTSPSPVSSLPPIVLTGSVVLRSTNGSSAWSSELEESMQISLAEILSVPVDSIQITKVHTRYVSFSLSFDY